MAAAFLIGFVVLVFGMLIKDDHDKTNICNKIYRNLVSLGTPEHLLPYEWLALKRSIRENWEYAADRYRKSFFGRAEARRKYEEDTQREERDSAEHYVDWSHSEPVVYGSHPNLFDEETSRKMLEQWREEMQQNRFSIRFRKLLREKDIAHPDVYTQLHNDFPWAT
ncbi:MAG: hypothetical protein IJU76_08305 [Desulfovibrionaceae bacterium]|nr:hypothetical protein [Desulfovibrionaceae bacterium]